MKCPSRLWPFSFPILCVIVCFVSEELFAAGGKKDWITLENCQLIPNAFNDGDSFHIRVNDTEYLVRLYFVDAPEIENMGPARLIEQAEYFGVSVPQVIEIGANAKKFVDARLAAPFTVVTRMAEGLGRSKIQRFYGLVRTRDGDLGEQLVANGLARIHGMRTTPPGAANSKDEIEKLEELEQEAKQKKLGGWGVNSADTARMESKPNPVASVAQPISKLSTPIPSPIPQSIPPKPATAAVQAQQQNAKLDVNSATKEQLEAIPGIGPTLSERIIAARPFKTADDLQKVKGIGNKKRYDEIRPYFN
jgi:DNA uptake protein ComE-like DNA-binding protein